MSVETINPPEPETDPLMMALIDRYNPEAVAAQIEREEGCGIDPQTLKLYRLGMVALNGDETDLLLSAKAVQIAT